MLNEIRRLFRQSVEAFRNEVSRRDPEDEVAELLSAMGRELVAARAALPEYEEALAGARRELAKEQNAAEECERRKRLAEKIGDIDTARIAEEFATRHREKAAVLEQKAAAAEAELKLRRREAEAMLRRYREADGNRFALLAELRRMSAQNRADLGRDDDEEPLATWQRMEEKIAGHAAYVDALKELEDGTPPRPAEATSLDERLRELKQRMGKE